jgi:membrane fusion protein, multidrug efflux system
MLGDHLTRYAKIPWVNLPRRHSGAISFQTIIVIGVIAVGGWFGVAEFNERLIFIKETDARIGAPMVTISSRVDGWLTDVSVKEGDIVEAQAQLTQLDSRNVDLELQQLRVQLGAIAAERARLLAERTMVEEQMRTQMDSRTSRVDAAQAIVRSLAPQLELARGESARSEKLSKSGVVSKQQLDKARNTVYQLEGDYLSAVARMAEAESERAETRAASSRTEVLNKEIEKLSHDEALLNVRIERQRIENSDRTVRSPAKGVIDKIFVEPGEYVRAGQRLAIMHDPQQIFVDANIKETELSRLKIGQAVNVRVDAYPDVHFGGKVKRIGNSTTGTFALLPNPNPSGNFTKITQRVPVRVTLSQTDERLHPGMMVEVEIDVR